MIIEDVVEFLKTVPPFQFLDEATLLDVVNELSLEFYPRDMAILKQDGPAADALRIIRKGGVKISVRSADGEEAVIDYRGEGDSFGLLSLMGRERQKTTVTALEDTICYLLGRDAVLRLIDSHPAFTEHVLQSHFAKYLDKTYEDMQVRSLFSGSSDHLLLTTRVGDIATQQVATVPEGETVRDAAQAMALHRISSIIIRDPVGAAVGIVTDRDLREKVVAEGRDFNAPVRDVMSRPIISVDARDSCFEALLTMIKHNIHHIVVVRDGRPGGVLTNHDLMLLQGTSPLSLARDIEAQHSQEGLATASRKVDSLVGLLIKDGAKAGYITGVLMEINDRLVRKVLELAEERLGPPPAHYCWAAVGSEGRRELVFKTRQDNIIIYGDPGPDHDASAVDRYFRDLRTVARSQLALVGYPQPPQDEVLLRSFSLASWEQAVSEWIAMPDQETLSQVRGYFDLRPVHGDAGLAEELRGHLLAEIRRNGKPFLGRLAEPAVRGEPALAFLRSLVVEKDDLREEGTDLGAKGVEQIADLVRILALEQGVRETGTVDRIEALQSRHPVAREFGYELRQAFGLLLQQRVHRRYQQAGGGFQAGGIAEPRGLSSLEKLSLKESFQVIGRVQEAVGRRYLGRVP